MAWQGLERVASGGGFIMLPDWLKEHKTGDVRDWKEFNVLLKRYNIEDDDGTKVDENWREKAVDRLMFEDAFIHRCNIENLTSLLGTIALRSSLKSG